jgi:hypothetical protein
MAALLVPLRFPSPRRLFRRLIASQFNVGKRQHVQMAFLLELSPKLEMYLSQEQASVLHQAVSVSQELKVLEADLLHEQLL